uniref:Uncharacterized protein n=1 Tax=Streptomyces sp. F12 TaxID=1436084 RepID=V9Z820_9ACTN|nr:hypothetical protein [Streptomyces sp. F12]AHE40154.1 hypothetical protein pFRL6_67 [Streptomyces sp. F12]
MQSLPLFPSFRLGADDGAGHRPVTGPGNMLAGHVTDDDGLRAHTPAGTGPRRTNPLQAASDAVVLHLYEHGTGTLDIAHLPYDTVLQAREDLTHLVGLRDELVNAAARAFLFEAGRQPHVTAILAGLDLLIPEMTTATPAACRRTARLLAELPVPARTLLNTHTGEAREWMLFPLAELIVHAELARARLTTTAHGPTTEFTGPFAARYLAQEAIAAVRRAHHDLTDSARSLNRSAELTTALRTLAQACNHLPWRDAARTADSCQTTTSQLRATHTAADALPTATARRPGDAHLFMVCATELSLLAADAADRLEATAAALRDAGRLGTVPAILATAAQATTIKQTDGSIAVLVQGRHLGTIRPTHNGLWTAAALTQPCHSPEGAITALAHTSAPD